jgi:hypothetical protein
MHISWKCNETEHVRLDLMPERAALVAGLVQAIVNA